MLRARMRGAQAKTRSRADGREEPEGLGHGEHGEAKNLGHGDHGEHGGSWPRRSRRTRRILATEITENTEDFGHGGHGEHGECWPQRTQRSQRRFSVPDFVIFVIFVARIFRSSPCPSWHSVLRTPSGAWRGAKLSHGDHGDHGGVWATEITESTEAFGPRRIQKITRTVLRCSLRVLRNLRVLNSPFLSHGVTGQRSMNRSSPFPPLPPC